MNILVWIILGGLAGWLASKLMKTDAEQGILANIVIGIAGAFIGGFLVSLFGGSGVTGLDPYSLIVAVLGAVVLLAIVKAFRGRAAA